MNGNQEKLTILNKLPSTMACSQENLPKDLICRICLEKLKDPRVLRCLHSFCYECIVKQTTEPGGSANCPQCSSFSQLQQIGDPSSLPPNYFANNVLAALVLSGDSQTKSFLCDNCDAGDPAETRCEECEIFICHFCSEYHRRSHVTKSHILVSVSDLTSSEPSAIARRLQCEKHKEEINLYCQTCEMTICRECIIADHRDHKYSRIQEISVEEKGKLQKVLDGAKAQENTIAGGISDVQAYAEHVTKKKESTIEMVRKSFEKLTEMIENQKQELIKRVNSSSASKLEQLRKQSGRLKNTLGCYKDSIEFIQHAFQCGNDAQILNMKKYISCRFNVLQYLFNQTQPCVDEYLEFRDELSVKDIEEKIVRSCSMLDERVIPEQCTASFKESQKYLKPGGQAAITIVCKDRGGNRLKRGGLSITPIFSGVQVKDVTVADNNDGSYDITFVVLSTGTLLFKANVCGRSASGYNLSKIVRWEIINASGHGLITKEGCTMEGQAAPSCYCVGDLSFESGIHTWAVNVTGEDPFKKQSDQSMLSVGVIDDTGDISAESKHRGQTWVYTCTARLLTSVCVELDMNRKTLSVKPTLKEKAGSWACRNDFNATLDKSQKVLPYFGVNSPYFYLSPVNKKSQTTVATDTACSSTKATAEWTISKTRGTGINYYGLQMSGEQPPCCFWLGNCSFKSGLHTWKVEVNRCSYNESNNCYIEVGLVKDTGDNSAESVRKAKKWVYNGKADSVIAVSVKLDMTSGHLIKIKPNARRSKDQASPLSFYIDDGPVFPYFSINSTDYVLSLTQCRSSFF